MCDIGYVILCIVVFVCVCMCGVCVCVHTCTRACIRYWAIFADIKKI